MKISKKERKKEEERKEKKKIHKQVKTEKFQAKGLTTLSKTSRQK